MNDLNRILSRHQTSEGVVIWRRCACGRLRMDLLPYTTGGRRLAAGPCPHCDADGAGRRTGGDRPQAGEAEANRAL